MANFATLISALDDAHLGGSDGGPLSEHAQAKAMALDIQGLTADSRAIEPGFLFAALPGLKFDGRHFIPQALEKGASAILAPKGSVLPDGLQAPVLFSDNPRKALSLMAAKFYGQQPRRLVAVTGTNGKTSIAVFTRQLWQALGLRAASMGTIGVSVPGFEDRVRHTTADPIALQAVLQDLTLAEYDHLALEASSHGLDQYRLDGTRVDAAAFTNLTQDHLDYHPDMAAYLQAKSRLFTELLIPNGWAWLNSEAPESETLAALCAQAGRRVAFYGVAENADLRVTDIALTDKGQSFTLHISDRFGGGAYPVDLPLIGSFQLHNALAALGLVLSEDSLDRARAVKMLSLLEGAPGRLQPVGRVTSKNKPQEASALVLVDYAHTPDALENVLLALRPHCEGRLLCLIGCGGDRDRGKRPKMAQIALAHADYTLFTDDNPRSEDPAAIRAEMIAGLQADPGSADRYQDIGDRRQAISEGLSRLQPGDVFVIAGKGHESGQIIGDEILPFDDRLIAQEKILAQGGETIGGDNRDA